MFYGMCALRGRFKGETTKHRVCSDLISICCSGWPPPGEVLPFLRLRQTPRLNAFLTFPKTLRLNLL